MYSVIKSYAVNSVVSWGFSWLSTKIACYFFPSLGYVNTAYNVVNSPVKFAVSKAASYYINSKFEGFVDGAMEMVEDTKSFMHDHKEEIAVASAVVIGGAVGGAILYNNLEEIVGQQAYDEMWVEYHVFINDPCDYVTQLFSGEI